MFNQYLRTESLSGSAKISIQLTEIGLQSDLLRISNGAIHSEQQALLVKSRSWAWSSSSDLSSESQDDSLSAHSTSSEPDTPTVRRRRSSKRRLELEHVDLLEEFLAPKLQKKEGDEEKKEEQLLEDKMGEEAASEAKEAQLSQTTETKPDMQETLASQAKPERNEEKNAQPTQEETEPSASPSPTTLDSPSHWSSENECPSSPVFRWTFPKPKSQQLQS